MTQVEDYDVCVVGSGAGGGAAAYALTRAGHSVAVLEKGPHYRDADFFHDEVSVCRRDYFVPGIADEPRMVVRDSGDGKPIAERGSDAWISCCVGGGTVHMSGFFFRLHHEDFRLRSTFGPIARAADWPIDYQFIHGLWGVNAAESPAPRTSWRILPSVMPTAAGNVQGLCVAGTF